MNTDSLDNVVALLLPLSPVGSSIGHHPWNDGDSRRDTRGGRSGRHRLSSSNVVQGSCFFPFFLTHHGDWGSSWTFFFLETQCNCRRSHRRAYTHLYEHISYLYEHLRKIAGGSHLEIDKITIDTSLSRELSPPTKRIFQDTQVANLGFDLVSWTVLEQQRLICFDSMLQQQPEPTPRIRTYPGAVFIRSATGRRS
jgi:hypothetical protein